MKRSIKITEKELHNIIKESVKRVLSEEPLGFSRKYTDPKYYHSSYEDEENGGNLDNPEDRNLVAFDIWDDADRMGKTEKDAENDYSWAVHDNQSIAPSTSDGINVTKHGLDLDTDYAYRTRRREKFGDEDTKNMVGRAARDKWVHGASPEYMEDMTDAFRDAY